MKTKEILKEAIKAFDGTVIVVSHDRSFLDGLVDKVYEFGGGKVIENLGGIYDFLQKKRMANLNELELSKSPTKNISNEKTISDETTAKEERKLSYAEQKERDKILKKAQKAIDIAEQNVMQLEEKLAGIEEKLALGDTSAELLEQYASVQKEMENAMSMWEIAQQDYDNLK